MRAGQTVPVRHSVPACTEPGTEQRLVMTCRMMGVAEAHLFSGWGEGSAVSTLCVCGPFPNTETVLTASPPKSSTVSSLCPSSSFIIISKTSRKVVVRQRLKHMGPVEAVSPLSLHVSLWVCVSVCAPVCVCLRASVCVRARAYHSQLLAQSECALFA